MSDKSNEKFGEREGLTFDDVLLVPALSEVLPHEVDTSSPLVRGIRLNIPIVSAPMDTVTEARLAIALAREGGLGIIHRNLPLPAQLDEVDKVKRSESGMIVEPVTLGPRAKLREALELMERYHISGVPIVENGGRLVGLLTNRDIRFAEDVEQEVSNLMTKDSLVTVPIGTTLEQAKELLHKHRIEKLPVVDDHFILKGLITVKDIQKRQLFPLATKDEQGRLRVGGAIGVGEKGMERAEALVDAGVDLLVIDTSHGHSRNVIETARRLKKAFNVPVIAGNVTTAEGTKALVDAGADAVKVGVGASAICTTRVIAGAGVPQITAIYDCANEGAKSGTPIVADGGIRFSGDVAKAIAAGADTVMIGSMFAGVDESPGEIILYQGDRVKEYRGMGSIAALKARGYSKDRYFADSQLRDEDIIAEGIEGRVPYKGPLSNIVKQLSGGLRAGMGYCGTASIAEMKSKTSFVRITNAGLRESHPHDVVITKEAPNYGFSGRS